MSGPRVLMCPPDHFGIFYEINAWMDRRRASHAPAARRQWQALRDLIVAAGAEVDILPAVAGLPDLVFTANAGLVFGQSVVLARFRPAERQAEEPYFAQWFEAAGFHTLRLAEGCFEGAGDALFCGPTLYGGYRLRSDALAQQALGQRLGCHVIPLELCDPRFYHLDTCFCPIAPGLACWYPPAFDPYGRRAVEASIADLIAVTEHEASHFACNAVVLGRTVITNTGCPTLHRELRQRGYRPIATPLAEFVKAGGSAKCLTLRLDGEDAAAWRASVPSLAGNL